MSPTDAVQFLGAILIAVGIAVYRIPVPTCTHGFECPACARDARIERRRRETLRHYYHLGPHPDCDQCEEGDRQ